MSQKRLYYLRTKLTHTDWAEPRYCELEYDMCMLAGALGAVDVKVFDDESRLEITDMFDQLELCETVDYHIGR